MLLAELLLELGFDTLTLLQRLALVLDHVEVAADNDQHGHNDQQQALTPVEAEPMLLKSRSLSSDRSIVSALLVIVCWRTTRARNSNRNG
jgi:hypothetical protein